MAVISEIRANGFLLGAPYKRGNGPWVRDLIDISEEGMNCQTFVHEFYEGVLGVTLPRGMWSQELFEDETYAFRTVRPDEKPVLGDIFCFGYPGTKPIDLHLAVNLGLNAKGQTVLRHANAQDRQVSDWTLEDFVSQRRYSRIHGIKRLLPHLFDINIRPRL